MIDMDTGRESVQGGAWRRSMEGNKGNGQRKGPDWEQMMNQVTFLFPDIPTLVSPPSLLPCRMSFVHQWPQQKCVISLWMRVALRNLLCHRVLLPLGDLGIPLWLWDNEFHGQPWLSMAMSNAVPPIPVHGPPAAPVAHGATQTCTHVSHVSSTCFLSPILPPLR